MIVTAHLVESTLCACVAALLALVLRRGPATTRYAIWLAAALKFLVPFSLLGLAGTYGSSLVAPPDTTHGSVVVRWLGAAASWNVANFTSSTLPVVPMSRDVILALVLLWAIGTLTVVTFRWRQWRAIRDLAQASVPLVEGREVNLLAGIARHGRHPVAIAIAECEADIEPGIFGIRKPVLIWPAGLSARLSDDELEAVLAHEACHVDRADNLGALLTVVVEAVVWFHPAVWWIGSQLVNERERACDEQVIRLGGDQRAYAEGIMKVCGFVLRAPEAFVAGVGGSNLSSRIEQIFRQPPSALAAGIGRGIAIATIAGIATAPLVAGVLRGPSAGGTAVALGAGQPQAEQKIYEKGDGIQMPTLEYEVKPKYTPEAMQARIQGSIWLAVVVLETGNVGDVTITQSLDKEYGLDDEAVNTVKQWRFKPGTKDGKAVAVQVEIEMTFKLK
jgi:bla regulator protein BlaR1